MPYEDRVTKGPPLTGIAPYDLFPFMTFHTGPMAANGSIEGSRHTYWKPLVVIPPKLGAQVAEQIGELEIEYRVAKNKLHQEFMDKRDAILKKHGITWPVPRGKWTI